MIKYVFLINHYITSSLLNSPFSSQTQFQCVWGGVCFPMHDTKQFAHQQGVGDLESKENKNIHEVGHLMPYIYSEAK